MAITSEGCTYIEGASLRGGIGVEARGSVSPRLSNDGSEKHATRVERAAREQQWLLRFTTALHGRAAGRAPQGASSTPRRCFPTRWHRRRSEGKRFPSPLQRWRRQAHHTGRGDPSNKRRPTSGPLRPPSRSTGLRLVLEVDRK